MESEQCAIFKAFDTPLNQCVSFVRLGTQREAPTHCQSCASRDVIFDMWTLGLFTMRHLTLESATYILLT